MTAHIVDDGLGPNLPPEAIEPVFRMGTIAPWRRKHPGTGSGQVIENLACCRRQPDRAWPGLGVGQMEFPFAVLGPREHQDFRFPTSGQEKQARDRSTQMITFTRAAENTAQPAHLICRQESFSTAPTVALDTGAGIGALETVAVGLGLPEDHRENRCRSVRGHRCARQPASLERGSSTMK